MKTAQKKKENFIELNASILMQSSSSEIQQITQVNNSNYSVLVHFF